MGAVAALLVLGFAGTAQADSGPGRDGGQVIQIQDRCDPATFDAALQDPNACVRDGGTTFAEFLAEFLKNGSVGHWRFHPDDTEIRLGQSLTAKNVGGEFHTFTEVVRFGPGCIELLNQGQDPPAICENPAVFPGTGVLPGTAVHVAGLTPGTHKFQCLIHPWMRTVVTVR
jgi:plastocyanin